MTETKKKLAVTAVFIVAIISLVLVYTQTNSGSDSLGPSQAQVELIQLEMKRNVPPNLTPIPKEEAEAGVMLRGPGAKK